MSEEREIGQSAVSSPAAAQAYRCIENLLVTLRLEPGSATTEKELIAAAGLGRTPVREAILRLAWEGLLEIRPRSGLRVAPLRPADWLQVIAARRGVEILLARDAARSSGADHAGRLRSALRGMERAVFQTDVEGFLQADKALDEAVAQAAANPYAERVAAPLQAHSRRFWFRYQSATGLAAAAEHHMRLTAAILGNDVERAAQAASELIDLLRTYAENVARESLT